MCTNSTIETGWMTQLNETTKSPCTAVWFILHLNFLFLRFTSLIEVSLSSIFPFPGLRSATATTCVCSVSRSRMKVLTPARRRTVWARQRLRPCCKCTVRKTAFMFIGILPAINTELTYTRNTLYLHVYTGLQGCNCCSQVIQGSSSELVWCRNPPLSIWWRATIQIRIYFVLPLWHFLFTIKGF